MEDLNLKGKITDVTIKVSVLLPGDELLSEFSSEGTFEQKDAEKGRIFKVCYKEDEKTGMGDTETVLIFENETLVAERRGDYSSLTHYIPRSKTFTKYKTPYGILEIEIYTHCVNQVLYPEDEKKVFRAEAVYEMMLNGESSGRSFLTVAVEKIKETDT